MPSYALACCKSSTFDLKIGEIRLSMTSGDLTFDLTKKVTEINFVIIFDTLSNAAFPVSLRGPGAELKGGMLNTPTSKAWKFRTPSGARVMAVEFSDSQMTDFETQPSTSASVISSSPSLMRPAQPSIPLCSQVFLNQQQPKRDWNLLVSFCRYPARML